MRIAAISALEEAATSLDRRRDSYLAYALAGNFANVLAKAGRYGKASEYLALAKRRLEQQGNPLGQHELAWIDGDIHCGMGELATAEDCYLAARAGFRQAREWSRVGLVCLDLAILCTETGRFSRSAELAAEAVPLLESLKLYDETIAAVGLLAKSIRMEDVKRDLLQDVRRCLEQDPLIQLSQERGPDSSSPAP